MPATPFWKNGQGLDFSIQLYITHHGFARFARVWPICIHI